MGSALKALRTEAGEAMVLQNNYFIEEILPKAILRKLSDEEMAAYRRPFAAPGEGRRPTLTWPRQIPIDGEPADVHAIATEYADWLGTSDVPKLFLKAEPGAILANDSAGQPRPRMASADREDDHGYPFRSGRFAGRDRAGHRRLDGGVWTAELAPAGRCPSVERQPHSRLGPANKADSNPPRSVESALRWRTAACSPRLPHTAMLHHLLVACWHGQPGPMCLRTKPLNHSRKTHAWSGTLSSSPSVACSAQAFSACVGTGWLEPATRRDRRRCRVSRPASRWSSGNPG